MNCFALPQVLWGLSSSAVNIVVIYVITWSLTLFARVGFAATARQRIRAVHLWTVIYLALIVSWIWTPNRFLVPILPLYLYFLVAGVRYVHSRVTWDARAAKALVWTFLVIAFSTSAYRVARDASIAVREHSATLFGEEPDNWPATHGTDGLVKARDFWKKRWLWGRTSIRSCICTPGERRFDLSGSAPTRSATSSRARITR